MKPHLLLLCTMLAMLNPLSSLAEQASSNAQESKGQPPDIIRLSETGKSAIKLEVKPVGQESLGQSISLPGKIEAIPTMQYAQHSLLAGKIISVPVQPGQVIHAGTVLAILESPDLSRLSGETLQTKAQILNEIEQQKVLLSDEIKQAKAKLDFAEANYKRDKMLFDRGIASQEECQLALSDLGVAQSRHQAAIQKRNVTLKALQQKLSVTMDPLHKRLSLLGVSDKEIDSMLASEKSIGNVPIRSTNDGLLTEIKASSGQSIDPTVLLFTVTDISTVWATASAFEEDIARLQVGEHVNVSVPPYPNQTFSGHVTYVGTQMDATTRTLPVRAEVKNPGLKLKPDMFARLDIDTGRPKLTMVVPQEAVVEHAGERLVFVEKADGYAPVQVTTGTLQGQSVEIRQGLNRSDRIVVRGGFALLGEWLKMQQGESAFSRTSGEGEVETTEKPEQTSAPSISPVLVVVFVLTAFLAGVLLTALVLRGRKGSSRG